MNAGRMGVAGCSPHLNFLSLRSGRRAAEDPAAGRGPQRHGGGGPRDRAEPDAVRRLPVLGLHGRTAG